MLNVKDFYGDLLSKCIDNGVDLKIFNKKSHKGCGGFVDDKQFVCAVKRKDKLDLMVHESCHLDQKLEKDPIWFNDDLIDSATGVWYNVWYTDWNSNNPEKSLKAFQAMCKLEIDCDVRAVEKIKKYNLDIDLKSYIRGANCYHAGYYYFHKLQCFYDAKHTPYTNVELIANFSDSEITPFEEIWKPNEVLGSFIEKYKSPFPKF